MTLCIAQEVRIAADNKEKDTSIAEIPTPLIALISRSASFDWNNVYRRINEVYDAMQEPLPRAKFKAIMEEINNRNSSWDMVAKTMMTPDGFEMFIANMLIAYCDPATEAAEEALRRIECAGNMQRLVLAVMLYEHENGKMPDKNWAAQIEKYLGEKPERYFSCPSNSLPKGETTYALVQYENAAPGSRDTILLVELKEAVPLDKAVVSVKEVLERKRVGSAHPGAMNVVHRSGAGRTLSLSIGDKELTRLLGREAE